ncbi:E3 ubiquitin-protein ligase TRIM11-like [Paroedura picta]|uniref:E3 ubiquitin-protein ligase TRIM11-like n=1 Tax=Paroedura picta TaxID=143630 RepID=UPI00405674B4
MAEECPQVTLQREVTCSICQDYLTDPYTVDCEHHFCRVCISRHLEDSAAESTCPLCKARIQLQNFKPNTALARFVKIAKQMSRRKEWDAVRRAKPVCTTHQEPLKYFCKTDKVRLCSVCDKSEGHEGHDTVPVEEAAVELRGLVFECLDHVRRQRDKVVYYKNNTEEQHYELRLKMSQRKETITNAFIALRELMTDSELRVCNEMSVLEKALVRTMEENMSRALDRLSYFDHVLEQIAAMCQLPESELLQTAGNCLQSWSKANFDKPSVYPAALKQRIWELCDLQNFMDVAVSRIRDLFNSGFYLNYQKVNVTLDPTTAHPKLCVSEDCKVVTWVQQDQAVPDTLQRFNVCPCVLGSEGFETGRLYWEVDVGTEGNWALGVAKESFPCKGSIVLASPQGVYAIGKCGEGYFAFEKVGFKFPWKLLKPMRIRVYLDYIGGCVAFADAENGTNLFEFREESFYGEILFPFFWIQKEGQLKIHS